MALSWRRLSMRKTCPIVLPEQNSPTDAISSSHPQTPTHYTVRPAQIARTTSAMSSPSQRSNSVLLTGSVGSFGNDNYNYSEIRTPSPMPSDDDEDNDLNNGMPSTLNGMGQQHDRMDYNGHNQLPELSALNSEFLTTILSPTPNYQAKSSNSSQRNSNSTGVNRANMHHETNLVHIGRSGCDGGGDGAGSNSDSNSTESAVIAAITSTTCEDFRPRQMGRRSEIRSRIVSITAERIAEGNPVSEVFGWFQILLASCQ